MYKKHVPDLGTCVKIHRLSRLVLTLLKYFFFLEFLLARHFVEGVEEPIYLFARLFMGSFKLLFLS